MRVLVAAGGSGGHVFPALAVLEELRSRREVCAAWIGNPQGIEGKIAKSRAWIEFFPLVTQGLPRKQPWSWPRALFQQAKALGKATRLIQKFRPDVVLATGGYPSVAPVLAARKLGVPCALHEQNAVLGLANRFLAHFSDPVLLSFPNTLAVPNGVKVLITGTPVRSSIASVPVRLGEEFLVLGGSLGSKRLLAAVLAAAPKLAEIKGLRVRIIAGRAGDPKYLEQRLWHAGITAEVQPFTEKMEEILANARLVLARAGASTLAELCCAGRPGILVPWEGATNGHQLKNAEYAAKAGGFLLLREKDLVRLDLGEFIAALWSDEERLRNLSMAARAWARPDAAYHVAWALEALGKDHK